MTAPTINPALQFIQTVGVSGFVTGVQTGMILHPQVITGFNAIGSAIDTYQRTIPHDTSLSELRSLIEGYPEIQDEVFASLAKHSQAVDFAVRLAARIDAIGNAAVASAAVVTDLKAPFDLDAQWRWIPPGVCQMGSSAKDLYASDDEKPLRTIMISGFYMLDHPVTNAEFLSFLEATGRSDYRNLKSKFAGDYQPAVQVTHEEATAYSKWLGKEIRKQMGISIIGRLPTEAEWEKAAKGPSGSEFVDPATHEQAHFNAETTRTINHPDAYANGYGLKDMIGNVWEWTSSPWREESFGIRGGSWLNDSLDDLRATYRDFDYRSFRSSRQVGFRPVLVPALSSVEGPEESQ